MRIFGIIPHMQVKNTGACIISVTIIATQLHSYILVNPEGTTELSTLNMSGQAHLTYRCPASHQIIMNKLVARV